MLSSQLLLRVQMAAPPVFGWRGAAPHPARGHRRIATIASAVLRHRATLLPTGGTTPGAAAAGGLFISTYAGLPVPRGRSELAALCRDVDLFGYCLIRDALTPHEAASLARRTAQQAAAEIHLARADPTSARQQVESCVNKGAEFAQLVGHPSAAPVLRHILGAEMLLSVHNAIISKHVAADAASAGGGGVRPMPLHTDQWWMPQPQQRTRPPRVRAGSVDRARAHSQDWGAESSGGCLEFIAPPVAAQCIWMASDFCEANGATWVTPGSHLSGRLPTPEEASDHALASAVPLEGKAGTCVVYDARLWHGTGEQWRTPVVCDNLFDNTTHHTNICAKCVCEYTKHRVVSIIACTLCPCRRECGRGPRSNHGPGVETRCVHDVLRALGASGGEYGDGDVAGGAYTLTSTISAFCVGRCCLSCHDTHTCIL